MENVIEKWETISTHTNYKVSSIGQVCNSETGRILKPSNNGKDYLQVVLSENGKCKTFKIHRLVAEHFIINPSNKRCVDHIDRNRLNNNVDNLRWASDSENQMNATKNKSNTSSTYKGVSLHKASNKWMAYVQVDRVKKSLGYFEVEREAAIAYNLAAVKFYKQFAKLNVFED